MEEVKLEKGWLRRQMDIAIDQQSQLPPWMRALSGMPLNGQKIKLHYLTDAELRELQKEVAVEIKNREDVVEIFLHNDGHGFAVYKQVKGEDRWYALNRGADGQPDWSQCVKTAFPTADEARAFGQAMGVFTFDTTREVELLELVAEHYNHAKKLVEAKFPKEFADEVFAQLCERCKLGVKDVS